MAVLAFGIYLFSYMIVGAFLTEVVTPKMTRKKCNDSVSPLWIR